MAEKIHTRQGVTIKGELAMKRFSMITVIVCLTVFCILSLPCMAEVNIQKVGSVVAVRGEVTAADTENYTRNLAMESDIYREDTIKTGKRGRIQIMFLDNTIVSLGNNSELKVSEYEWNAEENSGKMKTEVKEGMFRVMGGALTKAAPENFSTETPAATIGIRGSMYSGKVEGDSLTVVFEGGTGIDITNDQGTVSITRAGFGTQVASMVEAPKPPVKFTEEDMANLGINISGHPDDQDENAEPSPNREEHGKEWNGEELGQEENPKDRPRYEEFIYDGPNLPVYKEPEPEPWDGFFMSASNQKKYIGTGGFGFAINKRNGDLLGGGIPLIDTENDGQEPVIFEINNARRSNEGMFETGLHANRGDGGGVMRTAPLELQDIGNAYWGYADTMYQGVDVFYYWIAGRRTPGDRIRDLIARSIIGRYRGGAHGMGISSTEMFLLHNGSTDLLVNFTNQSINGQIKFDEITLNISGTNIFHLLPENNPSSTEKIPVPDEPGPFSASIIEESTEGDADTIHTIGFVDGMFYGDKGLSLGGNFNAYQNDTQYVGIFGGNRKDISDYTVMSGKFMGGLFESGAAVDLMDADNKLWYGNVNAKVYQGLIEGEMKGVNGESFTFKSYLPDSQPESADSTYNGPFSSPFEHQLAVGESGQTINLGMRLFTSNLKEFAVIESFDDTLVLDRYKFGELVFFGLPSLSVPTEGISKYEGLVQAGTTSNTNGNYVDNDMTMAVNWNTGKIIGVMSEPDIKDNMDPGNTGDTANAYTPPKYPVVFLVADVEVTEITNGRIFGMGGMNDKKDMENLPIEEPVNGGVIDNITDLLNGDTSDGFIPPKSEWITGTIDFGQFYGSQNQGFGMTGIGKSTFSDMTSSISEDTFHMIAAGFKNTGTTMAPTQTGTADWAGFAMGITQNVSFTPNADPLMNFSTHTLMVEDPESFRFTLDKDTGELKDGYFTLTNMNNENYDTYSFHFGEGQGASAWVSNKAMVAELGSDTEGQHGFLATDMLHMMPAAEESENLPEYVSWGYWGATYTDPNTGKTYTPLIDTCFWIAGERTPQNKINDLVQADITGTYVGKANGFSIHPDGFFERLTNGQTMINVHFGSGKLDGNISFDQVQLNLDNGSLNMGNITAGLSGAGVAYGQANGALFGPDATIAAGTFKADMEDSTKHMGVFIAGGNPK
ncbi:MAG: FecR family protein [Proteobacteria bacterium]|nr:FecR family protein [Pseudomonadota bacterium]